MNTAPHLRIGYVAQTVGLTPDTLRKWETRYAAVQPERTEGGDRRYSQEDLRRLTYLKRLVDEGHQLGSLAELTTDELVNLAGSSNSGFRGRGVFAFTRSVLRGTGSSAGM